MAGRRFSFGDVLAWVGAVLVVAGAALGWFTLTFSSGADKATFSFMGFEFTLGWTAVALAALGALLALVAIFLAPPVGRYLGAGVMVCGIASAGVVIAKLAGTDADSLNGSLVSVFGQKEVDEIQAQVTTWAAVTVKSSTGIGVWLSVLGGVLVAAGGLVRVLTVKPAAATQTPGWQAAAPQAAPYGQPAYPAQPVQPAQPVAMAYVPPAQPAPAAVPAATPTPVVAAVPAPPAPAAPTPPAADVSAEPPAAAPPASPAAGPARFCAKCGGSFADDTSRFCATCGAPRPGL